MFVKLKPLLINCKINIHVGYGKNATKLKIKIANNTPMIKL